MNFYQKGRNISHRGKFLSEANYLNANRKRNYTSRFFELHELAELDVEVELEEV